MRIRKEIESEEHIEPTLYLYEILEVLLDIRDLLKQKHLKEVKG